MTAKVSRITKKIFILSVLLFAAGCSSSSGQRSIEDLKSAPRSLTLGGNIYTLEASVWCDLMPTIDTSQTKGIIVSLQLKTTADFPAGNSPKAHKIFAINNKSIWETDSLIIVKNGNKTEITARGGPLWKPGTGVNVILEFDYWGNTKLISSGEIVIKAVY